MAKNYMQDVANILGVELGEEFKLDGRKTKYKFTENGLYFYAPDGWWQCSNVLLPRILRGNVEIVKLSWQPKVVTSIIIRFAILKMCPLLTGYILFVILLLKKQGLYLKPMKNVRRHCPNCARSI